MSSNGGDDRRGVVRGTNNDGGGSHNVYGHEGQVIIFYLIC